MPRAPLTLQSRSHRSAFTLVELLVAVLILVVIIAATGKIFSTATRVSSVGQAGADLLQTAVAIERQVRRDIERLSREGFLAIRGVGVPNNANRVVHGPQAPLIDPSLPEDAIIRADQLVFFITGTESTHQYVGSATVADTEILASDALSSRVYYGHAF